MNQNFKACKKPVCYHLIAWIVFIIYELSLVLFVQASLNEHNSVLFNFVLPYLLNIALFYMNALYVLGRCYRGIRRRLWQLFLLVVAELALYLLLMGLIRRVSEPGTLSFYHLYPSSVSFIRQLWRGIYFLILSSAYWLIMVNFVRQKELNKAKRQALLRQQEKQQLHLQLISSQNAFLQSQINPHLLFNSLNFIHNEVMAASPKASEAVLLLSDMMRYSLTAATSDGKVVLEQEAEQIQNLLAINQLRFDRPLCVQYKPDGSLQTTRIIPLLLLPFVENIFKYGLLFCDTDPAKIELRCDENKLYFSTFNRKGKSPSITSTGIGINNVRKRLETYYLGRHVLIVENKLNTFSVHLQINF